MSAMQVSGLNRAVFADMPEAETAVPMPAPSADAFDRPSEAKPTPVPPKAPVSTVQNEIFKKLKQLRKKAEQVTMQASKTIHGALDCAGRFGLDVIDKVQGAMAAAMQRVRG